MSKLPEARLTWWRVVVLALASACAHAPPATVPSLEAFTAFLPRDSASVAPFEPERLHGKVVVLTFVASWCFPCLADLITLEKLQRDFGADGYQNILVGMDLEGHRVLDPFAQTYNLTCPLVVSNERLRAGETPFGIVHELPTRLIFGRDGHFIDGYTGVVAYEHLERVIKEALENKPMTRW